MPRTIESIVENHRRAVELRKAGKPIWSHRADIRSIMKEYGEKTPENVAEIAVRVAATLRNRLPARFFDITHDDYDWDFNEAVEDLEEYTPERIRGQIAEGDDFVVLFSERIDSVCDWADRERVWLG